jgi:superfamily II DNA/RNA helicase
MKNFERFGLSETISKSLAKMDYKEPTPIQEKAIPLAMQGRDILGSAQTGTGKTAAFSIPLIESVLRSSKGCALVLTPTRELAKQVLEVIHQLLGYQSHVKTAFIIGGEPMGKQLSQLRARPRIIVGTPGRINDHLDRGSLMLNDTSFLVLDETDRMLDMGFGVQLDRILKFLPAKRQTLMFSATLPEGIIRLSSKYLSNPERVSMGATNVIANNIQQDIIRIEQDKKYMELLSQLQQRAGSVIVFVKTKHNADRMAKNLCRDGHKADALHGDLRQNKRTSVMNGFRNKGFRILVATDIAARGLDVPHIEHVINYDLPQVAEDYIHRMGRTARAGAQGSAVCFVSPQDGRKWHAIERLINPGAKPSHQPHGNDNPKSGQKKKFRNKRHGSDHKRGKPDFARSESPRADHVRTDHKRTDHKRPDHRKPDGNRPDTRKPDHKKPEANKPKFENRGGYFAKDSDAAPRRNGPKQHRKGQNRNFRAAA